VTFVFSVLILSHPNPASLISRESIPYLFSL
jgi:hypothetical protein